MTGFETAAVCRTLLALVFSATVVLSISTFILSVLLSSLVKAGWFVRSFLQRCALIDQWLVIPVIRLLLLSSLEVFCLS